MNKYEYILQLHDSVRDIITIKETIDENYIELKSDILLIIREISSETLSLFDQVGKGSLKSKDKDKDKDKNHIKKKINEFQTDLIKHNKSILKIMSLPDRKDAGAVLHLITYSQRLKDKLVHYNELIGVNPRKLK